jgi:type III pantothenate kinase
MLATFDISNTRITIGFFDAAELRAHLTLAADARRTADEYGLLLSAFLREQGIARGDIEGAAVASVMPTLTGVFEQACRQMLRVRALVVGEATRSGIRLATRNPREVGADRIVNAIAVQHLHGSPAIVVDLDTATAFDVVAEDGSYAGSIIAPGLALSAEALAQNTSRLQRVQLSKPAAVVGKDTIGALQSGLVYGHVALIEGLVERIRAEIAQPNAVVVATGELAPLLSGETRCIDRIEPWLSLIGLRLFYERNQEDG